MYKESCNSRSSSQIINFSNSFLRHYHSPNTSTAKLTPNYLPCTLPHSSSPPASPWPQRPPAFSPGLKRAMESGSLTTYGTAGLGTVSPLLALSPALLRSGCSYTNWCPLDNNVHESCTRMNSQIVLTSGDCAYWTDGNGGIGHGRKFLIS